MKTEPASATPAVREKVSLLVSTPILGSSGALAVHLTQCKRGQMALAGSHVPRPVRAESPEEFQKRAIWDCRDQEQLDG